jgi:hypothetical protein
MKYKDIQESGDRNYAGKLVIHQMSNGRWMVNANYENETWRIYCFGHEIAAIVRAYALDEQLIDEKMVLPYIDHAGNSQRPRWERLPS